MDTWNWVWPYVRASDESQEASPAQQCDQIAKWYEGANLGPGFRLHEPLIDRATTSRLPLYQRPYGQLLAQRVQKGDIIVVTKQDRAFRSVRETYNTVHDWSQQGVRFVCLNLNIDTSTPHGKAFFGMSAIYAEMERDLISERTKDGLRWRKQRGFAVSRAPWGWRNERRTISGVTVSVPVPSELERVVALLVKYLHDERGMYWSEIGRVGFYLSIEPRKETLHNGSRCKELYAHAQRHFAKGDLEPTPELDAELYGQIVRAFDRVPTEDWRYLAAHGHFPGQPRLTFAYRKEPRLVPSLRAAS